MRYLSGILRTAQNYGLLPDRHAKAPDRVTPHGLQQHDSWHQEQASQKILAVIVASSAILPHHNAAEPSQ